MVPVTLPAPLGPGNGTGRAKGGKAYTGYAAPLTVPVKDAFGGDDVAQALPAGAEDPAVILRREAERLNRAYDEAVNQHRKIKTPPEDPTEAYERFMPERPRFRIYPMVTGAAALFALLVVPAALNPLAVFLPALLVLGVSAGLVLSDSSRLSRWREAILRAVELRDSALSGHFTAVETVLGGVLSEMDWPLETSATFEASPDGGCVSVDVNLPEIEDLERFTLVARNAVAGLEKVPKKQWVVEREYQLQVHAILLRIAGEIYFHFPAVLEVIASGWTDRVDPATGLSRSEYIISVVFDRDRWTSINPAAADPIECVGLFPVRREVGEDSRMFPVTPFKRAQGSGFQGAGS
jgi:hypothetical protein